MGPATKQPAASAGAKTYPCPKCDRIFRSKQALGGHLTSHRLEKSDVEGRVNATLRDIAAPVREQHAEIVARLEEINLERVTLSAALARLDAVLKKLDPSAVPSKQKATAQERSRAGDEEKIAATLAWLEAHANEHPDGITPSEIGKAMKEADYPNRPGVAKSAGIVRILHARGVIVADHKTTGGGVAYKLVGRNGNKEE